MSNPQLAKAAISAVRDDELDVGNPNYPNDPGVKIKSMCSRFARCTTRKVYGQKYQSLFGGSAIITGHLMRDAGISSPEKGSAKPQLGSYLIKMQGSGGFGHIGIYVGLVPGVGTDMVADNSSSSIGRISGAKGFKTLRQFGAFDICANLSSPEKEESVYRLYLGSDKNFVTTMPLRSGSAYISALKWGDAMGFDTDWDDDTSRVVYDGKILSPSVRMYTDDGRAFLSVADLVKANPALRMTVDMNQAKVVVTR